MRNVWTWTNFCTFIFVVVSHTNTDPQQGSIDIIDTLYNSIGVYFAAMTSTTVSIWEKPRRTVNLFGSSKMQESYK